MKSTALAFLALAALAAASDVTVSVNGVDRVFTVHGTSPCSGSDPTRVGMCPGPQEFLHYGSCCVQLPERTTVVMGCMPLRSPVDTCDALAASLGHPSVPSTPSEVLTAAPATQNAITTSAPTDVATSAPSDATTPAPKDAATPAPKDAATPAPTDATTPAPSDATPEPTTDAALPLNGTRVQSQAMTDNSKAGATNANDGAASTTATMALAVGCCAAALAVVGGVLVARKKNESAAMAASPNTPPQPMSLPVGYGDESPIDEDSLTPLSAVVCM
ncbi:hypothetical protein SDRG_00271 [Saprolegnia diclina VS20]|uniref:Uncharacterized protein n=1 Tax=Saprolegnia diclina (strain VS20) TaxID=1156394 RepID=T0R7V0_SAPDV|nr:hypothetical protein SDRG_00271 [Saprolegnia diclina VS20]EQC42540.1 hypothetical protein SDRG_00271 [Saprolegnia diclina VS20]|eukprot:XP_008603963.1 hypothetical protein SDRG_00271 [Saprolegnia diclina VS20]